jgi:hypothetical protein
MSNKLSPLSPLLFGEKSATHQKTLNALGDILENFAGSLNALESTGKQTAFASKAAGVSFSDIRAFAWSYTPVYSELCGKYEDRVLIHIGFGSSSGQSHQARLIFSRSNIASDSLILLHRTIA